MAPQLTPLEWILLPIQIIALILKLTLCYMESLIRLVIPRGRKNVTGKVILITGAGGGFGRSMARKFSALGAKLVLWDIDEESCRETAEIVKSDGGYALAFTCDVSDDVSVHDAAQRTLKEVNHVDILINNAGVSVGCSLTKLTSDQIKKTLGVNLAGHFWVTKEFLPGMIERNSGHIVTVASMAAKVGVPYIIDYCASKWGAVGFTESLREEIRSMKKDIHCTIVFPMFADTKMVRDQMCRIEIRNKFGDMLSAEKVAECIVDGVLRNQFNIYIPSHMGIASNMANLLPKRGLKLVTDFIDATVEER